MKTCIRCGVPKSLGDFPVRKSARDGHRNDCKVCSKTYLSSYREENRETILIKRAEFREKHRTEIAEASMDYFNKNKNKVQEKNRARARSRPEHETKRNREWRAANKNWQRDYSVSPAVRAKSARRRAAKLKATPPWADQKAIAKFYEECVRITAETGIEHHVDHVIPLKGKNVCGLHVHTNLQILPATENLRKSNYF